MAERFNRPPSGFRQGPRPPTFNPELGPELANWWEKSLTKSLFVDPVSEFASTVGKVLSGEQGIYDYGVYTEGTPSRSDPHPMPTFHEAYPSMGVVGPSTNFSGMLPMTAAGGVASPNTLISGPKFDALLSKLTSYYGDEKFAKDFAQHLIDQPEVYPKTAKAMEPELEAAALEMYPPPAPPSKLYPAKGGFFTPGEAQAAEALGWDVGKLKNAYENWEINDADLTFYTSTSASEGIEPQYVKTAPADPWYKGEKPTAQELNSINPPSPYSQSGNLVQLADGVDVPEEDFLKLESYGYDPSTMIIEEFEAALAYPGAPKPKSSWAALGDGTEIPQKSWDKLYAGGYDPATADYETAQKLLKYMASGGPDPLAAVPSDPLALKPLQPGIAPWAQTLATPSPSDPYWAGKKYQHTGSKVDLPLKKHSEDWRAIFEELYKANRDENPLIREFLEKQYSEEGRGPMEELMKFLPPDPDLRPPSSTAVPHGFYTRSGPWQDRVKEFEERGFPGDDETRERAIAAGFDVDKTYWHAADYPAFKFLDPSSKPRSRVAFLSDKPDIAQVYGKYLYPLHLRLEDPMVKDWGGQEVDYNDWMRTFLEETNAAGKESAIGLNMKDVGTRGNQNQFMIMKPQLARSPWAKFDPKRRDEADWLAAQALPFNPYEFLAEDRQRRKPPA